LVQGTEHLYQSGLPMDPRLVKDNLQLAARCIDTDSSVRGRQGKICSGM
jgi:hypothetical protein